MNTYTDVVSAIAIRVADPLVSLRWLPKVLLLEEAEGEIDQSKDLEEWGDHIGIDIDLDPGGWDIGLGDDADVQQPTGWAGKLKIHVSFDLSCNVEHVKGVNVGIDADIQGEEEIDLRCEADVDTQDQIDVNKGPWLGAEVLFMNDWVGGTITLELPCNAVQYVPFDD